MASLVHKYEPLISIKLIPRTTVYTCFIILQSIHSASAINNIIRNNCTRYALFNLRATDVLSSSPILKEIQVTSINYCITPCIEHQHCKALNVRYIDEENLYQCRLLQKDTASRDVQYEISSGWSYYDARPFKLKVGPYCASLHPNPCRPCRCLDGCDTNFICSCDNIINVTLHSDGYHYDATCPGCGRATIDINGENKAQNMPGINLVVINHMTGDVEHSLVYATGSKLAESSNMATFIRQKRKLKNKIFLGAVKGDGAKMLTFETVQELELITGKKLSGLHIGSPMVFIGHCDPAKVNFTKLIIKNAWTMHAHCDTVIQLRKQ